jgi:hypothetical protein
VNYEVKIRMNGFVSYVNVTANSASPPTCELWLWRPLMRCTKTCWKTVSNSLAPPISDWRNRAGRPSLPENGQSPQITG